MQRSLALLSITVCLLSMHLAHAGGSFSTSAAPSTTETAPSPAELDARFESNTALAILAILESRPSQASLWNYLLSRQEQFRNKLILEFHTQFRKEQQEWEQDNQELHAEDPFHVRHSLASWISYVAMIHSASNATLDAARDAARDAAPDTTWYSAHDAVSYATADVAWGAAQNAARGSALYAAQNAARDATKHSHLKVTQNAAQHAALNTYWYTHLNARTRIFLHLKRSRVSDPIELGKIADALSELYFLARINVHGQAFRQVTYRAALNHISKDLDLEKTYEAIAEQTWRQPQLKKNPYIQSMRELFDWKRNALVPFVRLEKHFTQAYESTQSKTPQQIEGLPQAQKDSFRIALRTGDHRIVRLIGAFLMELSGFPVPKVSSPSLAQEE